ncbi:MAG TPA: formate dehydrogenase accessory sulfurtransferase FdhD [Actinomycetota bacterium]|nr:formate dehydrogenase accessory sulfurtransferase FdhD [Actinomycetota bacterium]
MTERPASETARRVSIVDSDGIRERKDKLATEEPLEVRVVVARESKTVAVTMRTPGSDFELAAGFLFAEGIVKSRQQIVQISYCKDRDLPPEQLYNIVIVELDAASRPDLAPLDRHFHISSACGVCGKASLDSLSLRGVEPVEDGPKVEASVIGSLPERLRERQKLFSSTGGLHAAGLFDPAGELVELREDVGRHNAVDKLVGWALLDGRVPLTGNLLMVSGRSSFEICQKAVVAGIPLVCSVSAPSSLAADVAEEFGMTLIGFVRDGRFNVYTGRERVLGTAG